MSGDDRFRFVSLLALELDNGDISLPSLPDVVLKIRKMLESEDCDFARISKAVSVDPVLVSRLFVFANSAYHNRANVKIDTLDAAIGRLGFEVVRNTAMSLAIKQLYSAEKHDHAKKYLQAVWARGMKLSCMSFAVAGCRPEINVETAFLCGLMHEVGTLYMLTKVSDFPELFGKRGSFEAVLDEWNPQISKCIIESWGFPEEMAESADPSAYIDQDESAEPKLVDVVFAASLLLDDSDQESLDLSAVPSCIKLGLDAESVPNVLLVYREKLKTMQESLN